MIGQGLSRRMVHRVAGACLVLAVSFQGGSAVAGSAATPAAGASSEAAAPAQPATGDPSPGVFTPGPGQEYELAFFIAAAVLTLLVAGGFIAVIVIHGRGSAAADREASPEDVEA